MVQMALRTFRSALSVLSGYAATRRTYCLPGRCFRVVFNVIMMSGANADYAARMTLLGGRLHVPISTQDELALGAVVYFRYPSDLSLSENLPGHPAR
eukprot:608837-Rhodomonas_salina.2